MNTYRRRSDVCAVFCGVLLLEASACSSAAEPSCKDSTAISTLQENIQNNLLTSNVLGSKVRVTKVEGSPVEQKQFALVCRAIVEISNADISGLAMNDAGKFTDVVEPFQIKLAYSVDVVDGELVTRADFSNLFFLVATAASMRAAQQSGEAIPGHSFGMPGR